MSKTSKTSLLELESKATRLRTLRQVYNHNKLSDKFNLTLYAPYFQISVAVPAKSVLESVRAETQELEDWFAARGIEV
jgi:hypothetical protein